MRPDETFLNAPGDGLSVTAYRGDGAVLLAFNLQQELTRDLAGFAILRTPPQGRPFFLKNRLSFEDPITRASRPGQRKRTPSDQAPFQKFRWVDFPPNILPGDYAYEVTAMYFKPGGGLTSGEAVRISFEMTPEAFGNFEMGFTRGYLSSQAYAERFKNADIRPKGKKTADFDTAPFARRYEWLGYHARQMIFDFLQEALADPSITVDACCYDLDEPDFIRRLAQLGPRLRVFLDNSARHTESDAVESQAREILAAAAGADHVKVGHFRRYAHNKVLIQKKDGRAIKALTGSANFTVRGLYVQANNILLFRDPIAANLYAEAFNQAFDDPSATQKGFASSNIASGWMDIRAEGFPECSATFSPHKSYRISLERVADEIDRADHSVLFAIMDLDGTGPVLERIRALDKQEIFSYGVTQSATDLNFFKPGRTNGRHIPFSYLKRQAPPPFQQEWSGGAGQVVHHKFVVVDFNDSDPVLFTGSSNLSAGGEEANGDNLLAIFDRGIATAYAVEAVRLLDHYHFRAVLQVATTAKPLMLQGPGEKPEWWAPYYDEENVKYRDRLLFSK